MRGQRLLIAVGRGSRLLIVAMLGLYALVVVIHPAITPRPLTDVPYQLVLVAAVVATLVRALSARTDRVAWWSLAFALGLWAAGSLAWVFVVRSPDPAFPSWADVGWLGFYLPAYVACVSLLGGHARTVPLSGWVDGLLGALMVGALGALALPAILADAAGEPVAVAVTLAYPLADLLLLGLVAFALVVSRRQAWGPWLLLGLGLAVFAISDAVYLLRVAADTYQENTLLDVGWPLGVGLMAFAPWAQSGSDAHPTRALTSTAVPVASALTALGLLVAATFVDIGAVAVTLAAAAGLGAVGRLLLTLREVRGLADSRRLAMTDDLTGLHNRRSFYDRAADDLGSASEAGEPRAMLLVDLDRFKEINDTLGHRAGDQLLRQFAERLRAALPAARMLARLGGDEFVALLAAADEATARRAGGAVLDALEEPFELEGMVAYMSASIGIALAPRDGRTRSELLRQSDIAMYRAKEQGSGVERANRSSDRPGRERLQLATDLRLALQREELVLHFQPKGDLASGRITGVEALARWQHPRHGLLYPDAFIEFAEQQSMMRPLTLEVLRLALRQQRAWRDVGIELPVAINLSAANLLDARLPADVAALLAEYQLTPGMLQFEITEDTLMLDPDRAVDVLARLSELGIGFALDDFGTGYSSLAHLKRLPVEELKIDKSFVMDMTTDAGDATIVRSTIELARNLGLRVVAEGVETGDHWAALAALGCHTAQGYYLSRPLPAAALTGWLHDKAEPDQTLDRAAPAARPARAEM